MKYSDTSAVTTASPARQGAFASTREMITVGIVMTTRSSRLARNREPSDANTRDDSLVAAAAARHDARHLPAMVRAVQRDVQQDVFDRVHEFVALRVAIANPSFEFVRRKCLSQECEGGVVLRAERRALVEVECGPGGELRFALFDSREPHVLGGQQVPVEPERIERRGVHRAEGVQRACVGPHHMVVEPPDMRRLTAISWTTPVGSRPNLARGENVRGHARSRRTTSFFPLIDVELSAAITWSTMSFGTSTVECRSAIWIEPIASAFNFASFTMAPTISPGLIFSLRPPPM